MSRSRGVEMGGLRCPVSHGIRLSATAATRVASAPTCDGSSRKAIPGSTPPPHPNIIDWLDSEGLWAIKRFEKSGDTVDNIAGDANLSRVAATAQKEKSEAILFSGGGNDLFTDIPEKPKLRWIWRALNQFDATKTAAEHVNPLAWDEKKTELRRGFVRVIAAFMDYAPIVIHGYDYLTASGEKAKYEPQKTEVIKALKVKATGGKSAS